MVETTTDMVRVTLESPGRKDHVPAWELIILPPPRSKEEEDEDRDWEGCAD
jgi:hypothetical protein